MAKEAAMRGPAVFDPFYKNRTVEERAIIAPHGKELRRLMDEAPAPELDN
jgi:NAD(P)H-hydrate repair Nnr-like enzyme with NAD(P)H-hydrate dehydratase domain